MRGRGKPGLFLVKSQSDMPVLRFETGSPVPQSGIYRVIHAAHRLPHSVTLFEEDVFPRCAKCGELVNFELLHGVPHETQYERIHVYELPVLEEDSDETAAAG